jgi:hypothetical protein
VPDPRTSEDKLDAVEKSQAATPESPMKEQRKSSSTLNKASVAIDISTSRALGAENIYSHPRACTFTDSFCE